MTTVTRKQFLAAIDAALLPLRDEVPWEAWLRLRKVGAEATGFSVGTYQKCPLTLAGYRYDSFPGAMAFAHAFDDQWPSTAEFDFRIEG